MILTEFHLCLVYTLAFVVDLTAFFELAPPCFGMWPPTCHQSPKEHRIIQLDKVPLVLRLNTGIQIKT